MSSILFLFIVFIILVSDSHSHQYCYQISKPEHGFVEINEISGYYKFSCEDGYILHGLVYVYCDQYDLIPMQKCTKNVCEDPPIPKKGQVDCDEGPLFPGKSCRFFCYNGYRLQGTRTRICKFNLQWSGSAECFPIQNVCENPDPPDNGAVQCEKGDLIPGKSCNFSCFEGYKLQGTNVRRCMHNYQWSGYVKCTRISENSYYETSDGSRGVYQRSTVPFSHYVTKEFIPQNEVVSNDAACENLQCEQLCLSNQTGHYCQCCRGYKLNPDKRTCKLSNPRRVKFECLRKCKNVDEEEVCTCPEGYQLDSERKTCIDIDECRNNNFGCSDTCVNIPGSAHCACRRGFMLDIDEKTCIDVNECSKENRCEHYCNNTVGSYFCSCRAGYILIDGYKCQENSIYEPSDGSRGVYQPFSHYVTKEYIPQNEVVSNDACQNLQCEQLCLSNQTGYHCKCCRGYKLNPDKRTCKLNNPRRVNFECLRKCEKVGEEEVCTCPEGYELDSERKSCIDIDECRNNNFGCSETCVNIPGSAHCACRRGFMLDIDEKTCIDVNECSNENRCEHYCNNTEGSYFCSCRTGFILIDGYKCQGCRRDSYWSYERNACVDCPKNSHSDSEGKTSIKDCVCNSGYTGSPGEYITCEDIDECSVDNFGCSSRCVNTPGNAYCICPEGFMLNNDNKTCIDVNECSIKNGGCEGLCINTNGSFFCVCEEGYTSSKKDRYSCDDIDECSENNGGCEHLCVNYRGGFHCICRDGYRLDSTLKNCTDIQCPKLPQPHYSYMNCTYKKASVPEKDSYPAGTICSFKCNKGFKNSEEDNKLKCGKDGTWKGTVPECRPQSCPPLIVPENGEVHPHSCSVHGATIKQKCTFSCHGGYVLEGHPVFNCKNNLAWNNKDIPICKLVKIQPIIKCPEDILVTLLQGKSAHNITVSEPTINMESYEIHPSWVTLNEPVEFQVGVTKITFTANSTFNETAQCEMTVTVLDEEPPTFQFCPDPIKIEGARGSGEFVTWDEPIVTDNVELESVFSLMEPNAVLAPGTYFVEYVARDSSGNVGTCSFDISIIRMNCSDLKDPVHGKANCMDWMYGKLCNPECEDGYMRDPEDTLYYSCDDSGVWDPSDCISECLQYTPATSSTCQNGFEFRKVNATGEEICIDCPSNAFWSATTRKCEK